MKPAICMLCGKPSVDVKPPGKGDWVEFSNYHPSDSFSLDHPEGLEYFCDEHLAAAKLFSAKASSDALAELRRQFGPFQRYEMAVQSSRPWWQRLFAKWKQ